MFFRPEKIKSYFLLYHTTNQKIRVILCPYVRKDGNMQLLAALHSAGRRCMDIGKLRKIIPVFPDR